MIKIGFSNANDAFYPVHLEDKEYNIRLTYNDTFDYWSFGVYTKDREPIVVGRKIVKGFPINLFDDKNDMPPGLFYVDTHLDKIGHDDIYSDDVRFYYIPEDEIE